MALLNITNATLRLRHFPTRWKTANIILIPKPNKDHTIPSNYRPISLLPAMSKVVEKIILTRLRTHSQELQVIPDEQFAFRPNHSTELQILRLTEHITAAFNRGQYTGAVFLDVAKAFDTVWHEGLLMKMLTNQYPISFTKLIKSYLHHRKFRIQIQDSLSTTRPMEAGVPQGTVLSPHLYTIYNSDIPHPPNTNIYLYADDLTITSQSVDPRYSVSLLQNSLDQLETWCNRWKVKINPNKSSAILFTKRKIPQNLDRLTLSQEPISWNRQTRYLGVTMDQRLTWKPHIVETVARAKTTRARLYPLLKGGNTLSLRNKRTLIKVVLQPQLTYASTAWGHAAKSHLKSLQAVENIALRTATDAPWYVRNTDILRDLQYTNATQTIRQNAEKRFDVAARHDNPLLRQAVDYVPDVTDKHKRPRHQLFDPG
jgi:Reverse transcriptase (RNA-dependent DNA polymerase).